MRSDNNRMYTQEEMTEMYRRGYNDRKEREFARAFGYGDPLPALVQYVEEIAEREKVSFTELLARMIVSNEEMTRDMIQIEAAEDGDIVSVHADSIEPIGPHFDMRGNDRGGRISRR